MTLLDELKAEIATIFRENWAKRDGTTVPETEDLKLSNDAVILEATVLYADLAQSTHLVDNYKPHFAAELYKAYLRGAARVARSEGGAITAYDGDRIMAVFYGGAKNTSAARTALKINFLVEHVVNPAIREQYKNERYVLRQSVGIDTSPLFVARAGIRGANDLVWIGRAANYAAKLCELSTDYPTAITKAVFDVLDPSLKSSEGKSVWTPFKWSQMNQIPIYRSSWWWSI